MLTETQKKRIHPLKFAILIVGGAYCFYVGAFVYRFDIFSAPVRNSDGWLGPLVRGDSQAVDVGKVWHTDNPQLSLYRTYGPLCRWWLWLHVCNLNPDRKADSDQSLTC